MAKHHHSDLPWSWLQNTKPYQLPPKNSIFWSSDFRKIPFLPLFLYIFCTKMAQMPQCHTYIYTWRNFYKKSKEQNGKTKKIFIHDIYGCDIVAFVTFKMSQIWNRKNFLYIYLYIYKFAKIRILWTWYRSIQTMYFYCFLKLYIFCTKMGVLGVLGYIYTHVEKIKKTWSRKRKNFLYINTKHSPKHPFTPFQYIFCTILQ